MKKACIIGAGAAGIACVKTFKTAGIEFDCYEKGSAIGGLWRYNNDNARSAAYRSLHINTNKEVMAFSDFPMPSSYPMFPHHSQVLAYFESYASHFKLEECITFNTSVIQVTKVENSYRVELSSGEVRSYEYVIVANGHHWDPKFPEPAFAGKFEGETFHSHSYRDTEQVKDKDVLIVGIGNSAVDIACETARLHTGRVTISTRSGAYIIPNWIWSMPFDNLANNFTAQLPLWTQRLLLSITLWLARGNQEDFGVPKPKRPLLSEHPTLSQDLLNLTGRGLIEFKPNVTKLSGNKVEFEDGSNHTYDVIIYATGYNINFPFLENFPEFQIKNNEISLYKNAIHPTFPNLFFLGLLQPLGAIMPLAEIQSKWFCSLILKKSKLPTKNQMLAWIETNKGRLEKRYKKSARHTLQVDFHRYKMMIQSELKRK